MESRSKQRIVVSPTLRKRDGLRPDYIRKVSAIRPRDKSGFPAGDGPVDHEYGRVTIAGRDDYPVVRLAGRNYWQLLGGRAPSRAHHRSEAK